MKPRNCSSPSRSTAAAHRQTSLWRRCPLLFLVSILPAIALPARQPMPDPAVLTHAFATRGCTQEDAPALEIYLTPSAYDGATDPTPPYLRFEISASPTEDLSNLSLELQPLRRSGGATKIARAEWVTAPRNSTFLSGTLNLEKALPGSQIAGRYQLITPNGQHLNQSFQAPWPTKSSVCG